MADILIRDMQIPKGCGVCPLNTGACYCAGLKRYVVEEEHVWMGSNYRRLKDCPLRELPPHGNLIDRVQTLRGINNCDIPDGVSEHDFCEVIASVHEAMEKVPVVVPADKEGVE